MVGCSLCLCLPLLAASGDPEPLPVEVEAVATPVSDAATFTLRLACTPTERLPAGLGLRVSLTRAGLDLVTSNHELRPRASRWPLGRPTHLAFDLALPEGESLRAGELISVRIGFTGGGEDPVRPPVVDDVWLDEDGFADLLAVEVPTYAGPEGHERLEATLAEARRLKSARDAPGAWELLERGLRQAADDATKERFRDVLVEVGRFPPAEISSVEGMIVEQRIRAEKVRVFRLEAGRMVGRRQLHGALRLLEEAGGELALDVDQKVLGALSDAKRVTLGAEDLRRRLLTELSSTEEARLAQLVDEHGRTHELLEVADDLAEEGQRPLALALYRKLRRVDGIELYEDAQSCLEKVGAEHLAATPPDQAEKVRAVVEHPAWERTDVVASHCHLFIGPRDLVEGIPLESTLRFDLAYVFLTDLFGRLPNPGGDRITVYFKELWDFGGGVGGGKRIDIGRANPFPSRVVRVDTGLLYHELTHCVDDTIPIFAGFREGLANLGAAYAHEALAHEGDQLHSFEGNLTAFKTYFLDRDLEYWRIQNYGPSAGFFLHFVEEYADRGRGRHDWTPMRRFFREYREEPVRDGREHEIVRSLTRYLGRAFGPQVFDDLVSFGFPLEESDRRLLGRELEALADEDLDPFEERFAEHPNSPLPRDAIERRLMREARRERLENCEDLRAELGILFDWTVIGPFFALHSDPGACVFAPEREIDFDVQPMTWRSSRRDRTQLFWHAPPKSWIRGGGHRNVELYPSGWLRFDYEPYGDDNSAIYAVTHVTLPEATDATAHVRADDDVVVFVNQRRIGSYRGRGRNGSNIGWRGPTVNAPDGQRFPVRLEAGRNEVLVKIRNRGGTAGMVMALSRPDGSTLGFTSDSDPPVERPRRPEELETSWKRIATLDARSFKSRGRVEVGSFRARNKAFYGTDTDGAVGWRLFTVRPGFPKDSPSNLLWLKSNLTDDLSALKIEATVVGGDAPKFLITFQGEGKSDGLSGWNLILVPRGTNEVGARLERYDRLVYQCDPVDLPDLGEEEERVVTLIYLDGWCSASIDGVMLLDRVSINPIEGRHRIGLATWGERPAFRSLVVSRGR